MQNDTWLDEEKEGGAGPAAGIRRVHFCAVVNQWCRGTTESGRPDDCLGCGRCEGRKE